MKNTVVGQVVVQEDANKVYNGNYYGLTISLGPPEDLIWTKGTFQLKWTTQKRPDTTTNYNQKLLKRLRGCI